MGLISWQLWDRVRAFTRKTNIYRTDNILQDQDVLDRVISNGNFVDFSKQSSLLEQTGLQINRLERYKDYDMMDEVGEVSLALDLYCLHGDTRIPLLNGTCPTIRELTELGIKEFWVYSYDIENKKYVPAKAFNPHISGRNAEMVEVLFDDGLKIKCTPDHEFLTFEGYVEAKNLKIDQSVIPLYKSRTPPISQKHDSLVARKYEFIQLLSGKWKATHQWVWESLFGDRKGVIHHEDLNKYNNSPDNFKLMSWAAHAELHRKLSHLCEESQKIKREKCSKNSLKHWKTKEYNDKIRPHLQKMGKLLTESGKAYRNLEEYSEIDYEKLLDYVNKGGDLGSIRKIATNLHCAQRVIYRILERNKIDINYLRQTLVGNHKVVSITPCEIANEVYDITVEKYHNFAAGSDSSWVIVSNSDEASLVDPERKHTVIVRAKSKKIQKIVEDLLHNTLLIDREVRPMIRYLCKYGCLPFEIVPTRNRDGVASFRHMNIYNFTRVQTRYGDLVGFYYQDPISMQPSFLHPWQVVHMRLMSYEQAYQPYGKCYDLEGPVWTTTGYKKLKDIQKGDEVYSFDEINQKPIVAKVIDKIFSGKKKTLIIKTKHRSICVTPEHPILCNIRENFIDEKVWVKASKRNKAHFETKHKRDYKTKQYVLAKDLKIGDRLILPKLYLEGIEIPIEQYKIEGNHIGKRISFPEFVNKDFARLIGFLIGDGWIPKHNKHHLFFAEGEYSELNQKYIDIIKSYNYLEEPIHIPGEVSEYGQFKFSSMELAQTIANMGLFGKCYEKRIPKWVFLAKEEIKKAFIEGLVDSDGSTNIDEWDCERFSIELTSEELVKDLKVLLDQMNIKCGNIGKRVRPTQTTIINGKTFDVRDSWILYWYDSKMPFGNLFMLFGGDRYDYCSENFLAENIISIENGVEIEVGDIQVDSNFHNFIADGVVIHNSILDGGRKDFKRLRLMEDAALVYRLCLRGDSRIWTPNGYKFIRDVQIGDEVYSYTKEGSLKKTKVINWMHNGKDKIFRVYSQHREIFANKTHPILVVSPYKKNNILYHDKLEYIDVKDLKTLENTIAKHYCHRFLLPKLEFIDYVKLNKPEIEKYARLITSATTNRGLTGVGKDIGLKKESVEGFLNTQHWLPISKAKMLLEVIGQNDLALEVRNNWAYSTNNETVKEYDLPEVANEDFAKWFGFMIGDGFVSRRDWTNEVGFALGDDEEINQKYKLLFEKIGPIALRSDDGERLGAYCLNSKPFVDFMLMNGFIPGAENKRIPAWVYQSPKSVQEAFIEGYIDADGCRVNRKNGITESRESQCCNELLIYDLKELVHRIGWNVGLVRHRFNEGGHIINHRTGRIMPATESWSLYFTENESPEHERILGIEEIGEDDIYDITVEAEEHNFIVQGLPTSNTRAPEKRVFTIPVGNIAANQVPEYIQNIARNFKKIPYADPATGQLNERYNPMIQDDDYYLPRRCISGNTLISLVSGKKHSLEQLISLYGIEREKFWVYSWNGEKIVPAKARCVVGPKQSKMLRVNLDDGTYIDCTPDHIFYVRNNSQEILRYNGCNQIQAKDLKSNDSLLPLYKQFKKLGRNEYEQIKQPFGDWVWTHREFGPKYTGKNQVIHHKDFNRYNNCPDNFEILDSLEHMKLHAKHGKEMIKHLLNNPELAMKGTRLGHGKWNGTELANALVAVKTREKWKNDFRLNLKNKVDEEQLRNHFRKYKSINESLRNWNFNSELNKLWKASKQQLKVLLYSWGYPSTEDFLIRNKKEKKYVSEPDIISNLIDCNFDISECYRQSMPLYSYKNVQYIVQRYFTSLSGLKSFIKDFGKDVAVKKVQDKIEYEERLVADFYFNRSDKKKEVSKQKLSESNKKHWKIGTFDFHKGKSNSSYVDLNFYKDIWKDLIIKSRGNMRAACITWNSDENFSKVWFAYPQILIDHKICGEWCFKSVNDFCGINFIRSIDDLDFYNDKLISLACKSKSYFEIARLWNSDNELSKAWVANHLTIKNYCVKNNICLGGCSVLLNDEKSILNQVSQSVLQEDPYYNHKVVSVEELPYLEDTYCLEVDDYHCFFAGSGVLIHNSDGTGPDVRTLPGAQNLDQIADIEYFKKKVIAATKIPFNRVGIGEQAESNGRSLSSMSPEFAKNIQWIQREVALGLKKMCLVHLALRGLPVSDLKGFDIVMTAASAIDELYRIETWNTRADIIGNLKETGLFPDYWILERFTDMTREEIDEMQRELEKTQKSREPLAAGPFGGGGLGEGRINLNDLDDGDKKLIQEYNEFVDRSGSDLGNRIIDLSDLSVKKVDTRLIKEDFSADMNSVDYFLNNNEFDNLGVIGEEIRKPLVECVVDSVHKTNVLNETISFLNCEIPVRDKNISDMISEDK